jgi:TPR repeat protein
VAIPSWAIQAPDFDSVRAAFEEGRYEETVNDLRSFAEQGRSEAQHLLGLAYKDALGVPADPEIAAVWFMRCAETGHAPCQYELGIASFQGRGVDISKDESRRWLTKAAAAGHSDAAAALASIYLSEGNAVEARSYLLQAADSGNTVAAVQLGELLEGGIGGETDVAGAADLYRRAAQQGEPEGVYRWALLEADGPAERAAVMRLSAEAGFPLAQYELASSLLTSGDEAESRRGASWLEAAAVSGMPRAQYDLAIAYRDGIAVEPNDTRFRTWLATSADAGFAHAQYELAVALTEATHGFELDYERAYALYASAAARGMAAAEYGLGYLLSNGLGTRQDFPRAVEHFRIAAEAGHVPSQIALGNLYANGQGVTESHFLAQKWYCVAARSGDEDGIRFVGGADKVDSVCADPSGPEPPSTAP